MKKLLIAVVLFFSIERFCHFQTGGFILSKMVLDNVTPPSSISFHQNLDIALTQSNTKVLMKRCMGSSETLTFIGAGKQFYVFETPDQQHVVKFMKFSGRRPLPWLTKLPFSWTKQLLAKRSNKLANLRASAALALEQLSLETALIPYPLPQKLILIDKLGIAHTVNRDQTHFIVQKKAAPFTTYFNENPLEAETLISSYIRTVILQCEKGICNLDPLVDRNYGVIYSGQPEANRSINTQVILMDIGSLLAHPKLTRKARVQHEIFVELLSFRQWLHENHPKHISYFDRSIQSSFTNY